MQTEQKTLTFKVKYGEEIRRFSVPLTSNWEDIITKISTIFSIEKSSISVKYEDDEKEMITLDSNLELQEAIRLNASVPCIRLEITKAVTPVALSPSSPSISEIPKGFHGGHFHGENSRGFHGSHHRGGFHGHHGEFHGAHHGHNQHWQASHWQAHHGHQFNHGSPCNIPGEELAEKLKILEDKGFKCKMKNIRLLKKTDGDVDKVCEILLQRKNKEGAYSEKLTSLQENGFTNNGINIRLLRRYDGDLNKVLDILTKSKKLEESGYAHTWMNIRLLIKFDGDLAKVEKVWQEKQEKLLKKAEKNRGKIMNKDKCLFEKAEKKAWKKCKKERKNHWDY